MTPAGPVAGPPKKAKTALLLGELVKFQHTIFALPFALIAALMAADGSLPKAGPTLWILLAMVAARSAAMGFNRIVDARFDRLNPRTRERVLPRGAMSVRAASLFVLMSVGLFVFAAFRLNRLCFALSPAVLLVLFGYSYTKRFTRWSHLVLGVSLGLAPIGAWLAITGSMTGRFWHSVLLGAAVTTWTTGFDILYGCLDVDFDRSVGLHSLPSSVGIARALGLARLFHLLTLLLLGGFVLSAGLGFASWIGVVVTGGLLIYEHRLVRPDDLTRLNTAFFTVNGSIGLLLFLAIGLDLLLR